MEQKEKQGKTKNANFAKKFLENQENKEEKKEVRNEAEDSTPKTETLDPNKGLHSVMEGMEDSQEESISEENSKEVSPKEPSLNQEEVLKLLFALMEEQAKHGKILEENVNSLKVLQTFLKNLDKTLNVEETAEMVYKIVKRTQSLLEKHQESLESIDMRFTEGMDLSFQSMKVNFVEYIKCIHEAHQKIVEFSKVTDGFLEKEREVVIEEKEEEKPSGVSFNIRGKGFIPFGILLFLIVLVGIYFLKK